MATGNEPYHRVSACFMENNLENIYDSESHRGMVNDVATPVGLPKRTKVRFTLEDDLILLGKLSQPGTKLSGFKVYQELTDEYLSYTVHGWRGRWVNHFPKLEPGTPEGWFRELGGDIEEERWEEEQEEQEGGRRRRRRARGCAR
ncbi:hypothetical protein BZA77DRAFT_365786 [Pyronema omphalodes]|nr:hypothetical protein BZA77DRAFT_365786 [Pyronema omphalodes]